VDLGTFIWWVAGTWAASLLALVGAASLVIFLILTLVYQVAQSTLPPRTKAVWIAVAIVLPLIGTVLWYFLGSRDEISDEDRLGGTDWFEALFATDPSVAALD
jgi:membrane protein implicated in regulation of membrane protease activity